MYENYEDGLATNTMSTTCSGKKQYDKSNVYHDDDGSRMAIYLGMAMEMP